MKTEMPPPGATPHKPPSPLPYTDTKPQGAADFYYAINATFRFVRRTQGDEGLRAYWTDLGRNYLKPVWQQWREGGLPSVAAYWKAFWAAEPGGAVDVRETPGQVTLDVRDCPAIRHIRAGKRVLEPSFCRHCYFVSEAAAEQAGFTVRIEGGNGSCRQTFCGRDQAMAPQNLDQIKEAT
jgi:hypothetical protein